MSILGKPKFIKQVLSVVNKKRELGQYYIEPFVGNCDFISLVDGKRIGYDSNQNLISMWKLIQEGWLPPKHLTENDYDYINNNNQFMSAHLKGYVDMSITSKLKNKTKLRTEKIELYSRKGYSHIDKILPTIKGVEFIVSDYDKIKIPKNSIIFCNPPKSDKFAWGDFWQWCRDESNAGHQVYILYADAPSDFKRIKEFKAINIFTI